MTDTPKNEAKLFAKLAEVMGEVGRVEKRGRNPHFNYDYVTEADLVEAVRSKLAERGVALIPSIEDITERQGGQGIITTAKVTFTFVDGETGAMFRSTWAGQGEDKSDKGLYKAYTGALKYFLMKGFLIATGDDPEADRGYQPSAAAAAPREADEAAKTAASTALLTLCGGDADAARDRWNRIKARCGGYLPEAAAVALTTAAEALAA